MYGFLIVESIMFAIVQRYKTIQFSVEGCFSLSKQQAWRWIKTTTTTIRTWQLNVFGGQWCKIQTNQQAKYVKVVISKKIVFFCGGAKSLLLWHKYCCVVIPKILVDIRAVVSNSWLCSVMRAKRRRKMLKFLWLPPQSFFLFLSNTPHSPLSITDIKYISPSLLAFS